MKFVIALIVEYIIVAVLFYYGIERMPLKFEEKDTGELVDFDKDKDTFKSIRLIMSVLWIVSIPSIIFNTLKKKYN